MAKQRFLNTTSHLTNLFQEESGKLVGSLVQLISLNPSIHTWDWRLSHLRLTSQETSSPTVSPRRIPRQGLIDQWPWSVPSNTSPQPSITDWSGLGAWPKSSQWAAKNLWGVLARRLCPIRNDGDLQCWSNSPYQEFKVKIQGKSNLGARRERLRGGDTLMVEHQSREYGRPPTRALAR